jgi:hypothetical protein
LKDLCADGGIAGLRFQCAAGAGGELDLVFGAGFFGVLFDGQGE